MDEIKSPTAKTTDRHLTRLQPGPANTAQGMGIAHDLCEQFVQQFLAGRKISEHFIRVHGSASPLWRFFTQPQ
jgi:hypothetical protein